MQAERPSYLTPKEYLAMERLAPARNEYYAGEIYAMAGASRRHVFIVTNTVAALGVQLKGRRCSAFANDLRVKVSAVTIASIDCTLALADIYDKIDFDSGRPALRLVKEPAVDYFTEALLAQPDFLSP